MMNKAADPHGPVSAHPYSSYSHAFMLTHAADNSKPFDLENMSSGRKLELPLIDAEATSQPAS